MHFEQFTSTNQTIKNMKKLFTLFLIIGILTSCSSDDDAQNEITTAIITLQNVNGSPASGVVVYAYDETTWQLFGDSTQFADFQVASDNNGIANFTNLTTDLNFNELSNFTETYRFSAHYTLSGNPKTKIKAITFNLGDDKTDTLVLD